MWDQFLLLWFLHSMYLGLMDLFISSSVFVSSSSYGPDWVAAFCPGAFGKRTEPKPPRAARE